MQMKSNYQTSRLNRLINITLSVALIFSYVFLAFPAQASALPTAFTFGEYPHMDAECLTAGTNQGETTGTGYWCGNYNWGYPSQSGDKWRSSRGMAYRNCTDGAAYWAKTYLNISVKDTWNASATTAGHAKYWDDRFSGQPGVTIKANTSNDIEPGDIVNKEDGTYGHVGFVTTVTRDANGAITKIKVAEMNKTADGTEKHVEYLRNNGSFSSWGKFIDVNGEGKGLGNVDIGVATDTDGDGVLNSVDDCANEIGPGYNNGCPKNIVQMIKNDAQPWAGPYDVGVGTNFQGAPSVVWENDVTVYGVAMDGRLIETKNPAGPAGWTTSEVPSADTFAGGVDTARVGTSTHVFAITDNGKLRQLVKPDGGTWSSYSPNIGNRVLKGTPSVVWGSSVNVFAVATDGRLVQISNPAGPAGWAVYNVGPQNNFGDGGVDALQVGSSINIFGLTPAGGLRQMVKAPGIAWATYNPSVGITFMGKPSVVWDNDVKIFASATDGRLIQITNPSGPQDWTPSNVGPQNNLSDGGIDAFRVNDTIQMFGI